MPVARTYLPLSLAQVDALADQREVAGGLVGVAVGPGGGEEAEYAAWLAAAELVGDVTGQASAGGPGHRRVIASADLDVASLHPVPGPVPTGITVTGPVALRRIVSFHVDEAVGSGVDDLLWFDVTELDDVRELLHRR